MGLRPPPGRLVVRLNDDPASAVPALFARFKRLSPGRLYTVTAAGHVKVAQPSAAP